MTTLGALLATAGVDATLPEGAAALEITSVELDSRRCRRGALFVCMPGTNTTGAAFVGDALSRGAVCILSDAPVPDAPIVATVSPLALRGALAALSSAVVGDPADVLSLVGVTGTNGKTTVSWLVRGILDQVGYHAEAIGTLTGQRTTPAAPELHRELRAIADAAASAGLPGAVAMEVSSHALDQGRVDGLRFDVAVFTNLSHEHLDYHGSMSSYFEAKATLFELDRTAAAVVCVDDEWGRELADRRHVPCVEVSTDEVHDVVVGLGSTAFRWRGSLLTTQLTGMLNVTNSLLALAAVEVLGIDAREASRALSSVAPVPGRLEMVGSGEPSVLVDYAHTPAALDRVLREVRALHPRGRVLLVVGCGGDRDQQKRPEMGRIATALADVAFVTSDNPRSEDPAAIIDAMLSGAHGPARIVREEDRAAAISLAIAEARDEDVVIVAGKGHESTQEVAGALLEFDDRDVARRALGERASTC